jgi:hypothetical protein
VTSFALSLAGIMRLNRQTAKSIYFNRDGLHVIWIHAAVNPAKVIRYQWPKSVFNLER